MLLLPKLCHGTRKHLTDLKPLVSVVVTSSTTLNMTIAVTSWQHVGVLLFTPCQYPQILGQQLQSLRVGRVESDSLERESRRTLGLACARVGEGKVEEGVAGDGEEPVLG